jgi:flagellar assembly protein FliH
MRNYARFIPGEEIEAVEQWTFGAIDTAAQLLEAQVRAREVQEELAQTESVRMDAYQAGYAEGMAQGRFQAQAELQQQMQDFLKTQAKEAGDKLGLLFSAAQSQLLEAEQVMAKGVLELSCELAREVLRHELSMNPNTVMPVLREALGLLAADCKTAVVKMNPVDLEALGAQIGADFSGIGLTLRADAAILQGGCLVESSGMVVDGTLDKRWRRAVASLGLSSSWEDAGEPS